MGDSHHTQNIQINKVIGENEKCVFNFTEKNHGDFLANPIFWFKWWICWHLITPISLCILISLRDQVHVVHVHNCLLELPRSIEVFVIKTLWDRLNLSYSIHGFCFYILLLMFFSLETRFFKSTTHVEQLLYILLYVTLFWCVFGIRDFCHVKN